MAYDIFMIVCCIQLLVENFEKMQEQLETRFSAANNQNHLQETKRVTSSGTAAVLVNALKTIKAYEVSKKLHILHN